ncbi:helix-turn-helix transcriptional regulator [Comamonas sp. UBA7528]|uniref:helix-turn-helix transcriptional regulator n=1 Tax=Comamonas sp. UBA7528 TaxID=1946391 RepID=UPI0039C889F2
MPTTASTPLNLLRANQVCSKLRISKTTLYAKLDKSSKYYDPEFPKQIKLGVSSVGWIEQQVDQWITNKLLIG